MPKVTLFYAQSDPLVTLNDLCPKWLKIYALSDPPAMRKQRGTEHPLYNRRVLSIVFAMEINETYTVDKLVKKWTWDDVPHDEGSKPGDFLWKSFNAKFPLIWSIELWR